MVASWACKVTLVLAHKRGFLTASLCEDFSDLTSPTSNHIHLQSTPVVPQTFVTRNRV